MFVLLLKRKEEGGKDIFEKKHIDLAHVANTLLTDVTGGMYVVFMKSQQVSASRSKGLQHLNDLIL